MKRYIAAAVLCSCVVLDGCNSKELTRDKAKSIIESSELFKPQKRRVLLMPPETEALTRQKLALWQGIGIQSLFLTDAGKKYFESPEGQLMGFGMPMVPASVVLPQMLKPKVVEITGIAPSGDESEKVVDYKWQWATDEVPATVKTLMPSLLSVNDQSVAFKLYDDGWRADWTKPAKH